MTVTKNDRLFVALGIVYLVGLIIFFFARPPILTLLKKKPPRTITPTTTSREEPSTQALLPVSAIRWVLPPDPIKGMEQLERIILERTNEVRIGAKLKPLKLDMKLREIALAHSKDMADRNYLAHESPEGISPLERVGDADRKLIGLIGENLFMIGGLGKPLDETRVAVEVMTGLINGSQHRTNILDPDYTDIGIGGYFHNNTVYVTEVFAAAYAHLDDELPLRVQNGQILTYRGKLLRDLDTSRTSLMLRDVNTSQNAIRLGTQWTGPDRFQGQFSVQAAKGMYSFGLVWGKKFITGPFIVIE